MLLLFIATIINRATIHPNDLCWALQTTAVLLINTNHATLLEFIIQGFLNRCICSGFAQRANLFLRPGLAKTSGLCDWLWRRGKFCMREVFRFALATRHIMSPHHMYVSSHQPFRPITATRQMVPSLHFLGQRHIYFATSLHGAARRVVVSSLHGVTLHISGSNSNKWR